MTVRIHKSWKTQLREEFEKDYFKKLTNFVRKEYQSGHVYPQAKQIFNAFDHCPFEDVKVVILGQDPYHGPGQAHGLCFSVKEGVKSPPSLQNIYKELNDDLGIAIPESGDLTHWSEQGVLLLNATLTVKARQAGSHQNKGWEEFTNAVIESLNQKKENLIFILWGRYAQEKGSKIDADKHLVLKAPHPSPFSAHSGFFGSKPFSKTNDYLAWHGKETIKW